MRSLRYTVPLLAGVLVIALCGLVRAAADGSRQAASYKLTQRHPHKGTAERFRFDYVNPDDAAAKPPAVRRVVTVLPGGARYNTSVPGQCQASDAELMAAGADACPPDSRIGGGVVTVDSGVPGPGRIVTADVEFVNNAGQFIYVNTVRGTAARTVIRAAVTRRMTITDAGMLPGTPPDGGAIDTVDLTVNKVSRRIDGRMRHYITTPRRCSRKTHFWRTQVRFAYADGVEQTVGDTTPCKPKHRRGR